MLKLHIWLVGNNDYHLLENLYEIMQFGLIINNKFAYLILQIEVKILLKIILLNAKKKQPGSIQLINYF